jgi:hypothetical protein
MRPRRRQRLHNRRKTPKSPQMLKHGARLVAAVGLVGVLFGCNKADEALTQRLLEANDKVLACQKELAQAQAQAKSQVAGLKRQVAEAVANPTRIQLTDPEIIELVASIRGPAAADTGGGLDPQKASAIVLRGAPAMQACYERALKNSASLQRKSGVGLKLGITVRPNGAVEGVDVAPNVDDGMTGCIRAAASRWKFPAFSGRAVTIEQQVKLTPKT